MRSLLVNRRARGAVAAFASSALAFGGAAALLGAENSSASSHRESPQLADDPPVDHTDLYAFVSPDSPDTVTFIDNTWPFEDPAGGPNFFKFDEDARYNINIDNNGDAKPDITYRWTFKTSDKRGLDTFLYNNGPVTSINDATLLLKQTYTLEKIEGGKTTTLLKDAPVAPSNVGAASMPDYSALRQEAITGLDSGGASFAGQADDPFFLDLRIFDLLYGGDLSETGADTLSGKNVQSIALQVPISELTSSKDPVIGVWATNERPSMKVQSADGSQSYKGDYVQVSRLGNPLVNEVVIPAGLKDAFNALAPENDASVQAAVDRVNDPEVPKLIQAIYGIPAPKAPRDDLFSVFLTGLKGLNMPKGKVQPAELLRLNTSIAPTAEPMRLGVLAGDIQGYPNGRRLTDDVVDIELQALEGAVRTGKLVAPLAAGDGVDSNDLAFESTFPYIALPHSGSGVSSASGPVGAGGGGTARQSTTTPEAASPAPAEDNGVPMLAVLAALLGLGLGGVGVTVLRRGRQEA